MLKPPEPDDIYLMAYFNSIDPYFSGIDVKSGIGGSVNQIINCNFGEVCLLIDKPVYYRVGSCSYQS